MDKIKQSLYMQIYNDLVNEIRDGKYHSGDRIPTEKEFAERYQVSRITSRKALDLLVENGYIDRTPGRGSFVSSNTGSAEHPGPENTLRPGGSTLGLIIPDFGSSYGMDLLSGIEKEATSNGYRFTFCRTYGDQVLEEKAIDMMIESGVEGIIIMPVHGEHYNPKIMKMSLDGFPFIMVDRCLKGIPAPFIGSDNIEAAKKLTDYLLDLGHRNISFISPPAIDTSTIEDRMEGFVKSHAERGVTVDQSIWLTNLTSTVPGMNLEENMRTDIEKIKNLLKENPGITCFFVVEYNLALIVLEAIKSMGKTVPDDYSIVCFDGPVNFVGDYFFTFIRQQELEMGKTAVRTLLKQIEKKNGNDHIFLETILVKGNSTKSVEV